MLTDKLIFFFGYDGQKGGGVLADYHQKNLCFQMFCQRGVGVSANPNFLAWTLSAGTSVEEMISSVRDKIRQLQPLRDRVSWTKSIGCKVDAERYLDII